MLTTSAHQQSLADAGSETRPPMLERGSYIPWARRFRRYLNRKMRHESFLIIPLIMGTALTDVDRETRFDNKFDQFTAAAGESLVMSPDVRLARNVRDIPYDELFDYLQQYEKLVIASTTKKLEKIHDPLGLVAHTSSSSSRSPPPYYVTHPPSMVDYDDDYQGIHFKMIQNILSLL
ncbi:hypothetical protein Tco_0829895 [Tanacetum coccineum]